MFHLRNTSRLIRACVTIFISMQCYSFASAKFLDCSKKTKKYEKIDVVRIAKSPFYEKIDSIIELCKKRYPKYDWKDRQYFTLSTQYCEFEEGSYKEVDTPDFKRINMMEKVSKPIFFEVFVDYGPIYDNLIIYKSKRYSLSNLTHWNFYKKKYGWTRRLISYIFVLPPASPSIIILYKPNGTMSIKDVYYGIDDIGGLFTPEELKELE